MNERDETLAYLDKVKAEVLRRREVVHTAELLLGELEMILKKQGGGTLDVQLLKTGAGQRTVIQRKVVSQKQVLKRAIEDLRRAEEREQEVLAELEALNVKD